MDQHLKSVLNLKPHFCIEDSIPIIDISDEGIMEVRKGLFSRTYRVRDINFGIAQKWERGEIANKWMGLLKGLDPSYDIQICVDNHNIDVDYLSDAVLLREAGDEQDELRADINKIIRKNLTQGNNSIKRDIYLTLTIPAENMQLATSAFLSAEHNIISILRTIPGSGGEPLRALKRLNLIRDIYRGGDETEMHEYGYIGRDKVRVFGLEKMYESGVTAAEIVQPGSMAFKNDHFVLGDKYGRCFSLVEFPTIVTDTMLRELSTFSFNMLFTMNARQMDPSKARDLVKAQRTNAAGSYAEVQKKASQAGYSAELTNPELKNNFNEANMLLEDIERRDQKLFETKMHAVIFADSLEQLDKNCKSFQTKCRLKGIQFDTATGLQENVLISAMPFGFDCTPHSRTLTTETFGIFIPFSSQEMTQKGGTVYGLNKITHNIITFNRMLGDNYSMMILGSSGSGKSFFAKKEILATFLGGVDADVVIIDPQAEYGKLAEAVGGQEIIVEGTGIHHINPMDISVGYGENPVAKKAEFAQAMCSEMLGYTPNATQKTAISISVNRCYDNWKMTKEDKDIPTLADFYNALVDYYNTDGAQLPDILDVIKAVEFYVKGTTTLFLGESNVDTNAQFMSYNISDLDESISPLAMLIILDSVLNRMSRNRKLGRFTFVYIDEMHLLFQNEQTALWIRKLWKIGRKYKCAPCGITQDVEDLLSSPYGRAVLNNTSFNVLLKQTRTNAALLADELKLSARQLDFVTDTPSGEGILCIQNAAKYTGGVIPFEDHYPEDSMLFEICQTSDMAEKEEEAV